MSDQTNTRTWIVTVGPDASLVSVAQDLENLGFKILRVLDAVGVIEAQGGEPAVKKARKVPGVLDVEPDAAVDIGPPGADPS